MSEEADQNTSETTSAEPVESPGARLRAARESKGLDIQDVAYALHADARVLAAMEADDFEHLGAPVFVRGHLRHYARYLELDADALVRDYETLAQPEAPDLVGARTEVRVGAGPGAGPWISVVSWIVGVILLILAGIWLYHHPLTHQTATQPSSTVSSAGQAEQSVPPDVASVPGDMVGRKATAEQTIVPAPPQSTPSADAGTAGKVTQAQPPQVTQGAGTQETEQQNVPAATGSAVSTPPATEVTLDLSLGADSWIEVYDASGERLYYDLAQQGSTVHVRGTAPLRVFLGDSPSVVVHVDGKPFDQSRFQHSDNTARFRIAAPAVDAGGN